MVKLPAYTKNLEITKALFKLYRSRIYKHLTFNVIKHKQFKWDPFTNYELIYPFLDKWNLEWVEVTFKHKNYLDPHNDYIQIYCLLDQIGRFHVTDDGLILDEIKQLLPDHPDTILAVTFPVLHFKEEIDIYFQRLRDGFKRIERLKRNMDIINKFNEDEQVET